MTTLSAILLIGGAMVFIVSFIMPEMGSELDEVDPGLTKKQLDDLIEKEMKDVRSQVADIVEETSNYSVEKTERALERLTNEKISAVSEYSETVMEDIHKSHEEVMFLYDMLNNKHEDLKETASQVSASVKEARVAEEALSNASREAMAQKETAQEAEKEEEEKDAGEEEWIDYHSEAAKAFFAQHEEGGAPTMDEIRASFQPMTFGKVSEEEEGRIYGGSGEETYDETDEAEEAVIDALLADEAEEAGDAGAEESEAEAAAAEEDFEGALEATIDELLGVDVKVQEDTGVIAEDTYEISEEERMDAALAALTGGGDTLQVIGMENASAMQKESQTALENEAASMETAEVAIENENAADDAKTGAMALSNDASAESSARKEAFTKLSESITAIMEADPGKGDSPKALEKEAADALLPEKKAKTAKSSAKKSTSEKSGAKKSKKKAAAGAVSLQFSMDAADGGNHNERILELHKKGKSNI